MVAKKASARGRNRLLTIGEAAAELGVSAATLRNWDRLGKLAARRHPINDYRLYRAADILALKIEIQGEKQ
jgi:DNA-binding transcriptional MerR regulator